MKNIIGLKELRQDMLTYIERVQKGESFIVVKRSRPIFKIAPPEEGDGMWERVADFTKIEKGGVSARKVLAELRKLNA